MRFTRLALVNWKNFKSVDVSLAPRTFVIGANASGKSNFLEAFKFLRDLASPGGGLAEACRLRGGVKGVRSVFARRNPNVQVVASVELRDGSQWTYDLAIESVNGKGTPRVAHEIVHKMDQNGGAGEPTVLLQRPNHEDRADTERLTQTAIEQTTANRDFRDLAEFFRSIRYLHLVPQVVREGALKPELVLGEDSMGRDLLDRIAETNARTRASRLERIRKALKVAAPQFESLELHKDERGRPHLRARFQHWRPQGAFHDETQFSDGTLRLIGLFWSLMDGGGPLLLEEPELSLHSELLPRLAPLMHRAQRVAKGRQVIVSTHSRDLLSDEGIGPEEILLIETDEEGSKIIVGSSDEEIRNSMVMAGLGAHEAALPRTSPGQADLFENALP